MSPAVREPRAAALHEAVCTIEENFAVVMGSEPRVAAACSTLLDARDAWRSPGLAEDLTRLAWLLPGRTDPLVTALFDLLESVARASPDPWPLLAPLMRAGPPALVLRALEALRAAFEHGRLRADDPQIAAIAAVVEERGGPLTERASLEVLAALIGDAAPRCYVGAPDPAARRLAARTLDLAGRPPARNAAMAILGEPAYAFLAPYLEFTRATHLDLLAIAGSGDVPAMPSLQAAEDACGAPLLREVVAALGWDALNLGIEARPLAGISIGGGLPLLLERNGAELLDGCPGATRIFERTLFVAHGTRPAAAAPSSAAHAAITRFRECNLAHAQVLGEFLDLAPLTAERVDRLLAAVRRLVEDFVALFPDARDECRGVQAAYETIATRVAEARVLTASPELPAEVSRLVQPFEDPSSVDAIHTLHGLKRYLHQRGLHLGFRLVHSGREATRSVSVAVASGQRVMHAMRLLEYADFDCAQTGAAPPPYSVRVVVEGFARQLLHGEARLPSVRVFCYGNEVHYFISYRNHPALVRVDYSPPFAGGMIDLEYYGVSKYELSHHPNVSLAGVRTFFRRLDFEVSVENTRIHARYDKERALDLADICARAESLFRLAPYLMDIDWVLGNLDLTSEAREAAAHAWADRFARWGVLPLGQVLSADRRSILLRDEPHPAGPRERTWRGDLPYDDRLMPEVGAEATATAWISAALATQGIETSLAPDGSDMAQVPFDIAVIARPRQAVSERRRAHEATRLARRIADGGGPLLEAAGAARVLAPLDRFLRYATIGRVSGRAVQRAPVFLPDGRLTIAVLRDDSGGPAIAEVVDESTGHSLTAPEIASSLRARNFPVGTPNLEGTEADDLRVALSLPGTERGVRRVSGERRARGVRATPGTAVGLVRFGTAHRAPGDLDGEILVMDRLSPDDSPFLVRAGGVVCTGGGVLSHAGLLAAQFGKPALLIEGRWTGAADAGARLQFWSIEYEETESVVGPCAVVEYRDVRRREEWLRDGDLAEVCADDGLLRVFGQEPDALSLQDALRRLDASETRLAKASSPEHVLLERGRRAHALHQLERLLGRLERADLVSFATRRLLKNAAVSPACESLLRVLLRGPEGETARACLEDQLAAIAARREDAQRLARGRIPRSEDPFEIVALRLAAHRANETLAAARSTLHATAVAAAERAHVLEVQDEEAMRALDRDGLQRLHVLQQEALIEAERAARNDDWAVARHAAAAAERIGEVLARTAASSRALDEVCARLSAHDLAVASRSQPCYVLSAADGGAELSSLVGSKAANLAEAVRLDVSVAVPDWFVITNAAFQEALGLPSYEGLGVSVRDAIRERLGRAGLDDRQRSRAIATIWEQLEWPPALSERIRQAYRALADAAGASAPRSASGDLLVAVRSSAFEEDRPETTRAGEFDTFLFVAGEESLLAHVKRAWSGFWTPRAIHNRSTLGTSAELPGGGILVQRIVDARSAGVIQTINVADGRPWEMAVDVAFGLGEGVVSGRVAADHVTIVKGLRGRGGLRFTYATADKRERVVFDSRVGAGTCRADTLYHQRMRPALEYGELEALADVAERLERAWREALDIEFAIDGKRLWLLQARPVPSFHAVWRETARRHPLIPDSDRGGLSHDSPR